jgi:hypothetical protein
MPVVPFLSPFGSPEELEMQRINTEAFIRARPLTVQLIPRTQIVTGTGARWEEQPARPFQVVRLVELASQTDVGGGSEAGGDGFQHKGFFQMVMEWNAEVGLNDTWVDQYGIRFEVKNLLTFNGYERRAEVTRYGETG